MMTRSSWQGGSAMVAGSVAIVGFCLGVMADPRAFFACWLAAWWACAGAVLGSQANLWLHDLSGGAWGGPLRPIWHRATAAMPMLIALMLPLLAAVWMFYPWSDPAWNPSSGHPDFQAFWLMPAFVTVRLITYTVLWLALSLLSSRQYPHRQRKGVSALGLVIYGLTISLAGVDLVQSLLPQWYSSGFGLIVIVMHMKLGFAIGVVGATAAHLWHPPPQAAHCKITSHRTVAEASAPFPAQLGRDWGNLLLMYVMMWAYLAFVQFLIIWAENLPNEILWYVPRLHTDWVWLGTLLVAAGFFVPLFLLLLRAVKQHRQRLRVVAIALCVIGWLESVWITLPSVPGLTWHALWMAPLALIGMTALLWSMAQPGARHPPNRNAASVVPQQENKS